MPGLSPLSQTCPTAFSNICCKRALSLQLKPQEATKKPSAAYQNSSNILFRLFRLVKCQEPFSPDFWLFCTTPLTSRPTFEAYFSSDEPKVGLFWSPDFSGRHLPKKKAPGNSFEHTTPPGSFLGIEQTEKGCQKKPVFPKRPWNSGF